jgi:hypothetical protein
MPVLGFGYLRSHLESINFGAILSIASTPSGFVAMMKRQPEYRQLVKATEEDFEVKSALIKRIGSLVSQAIDERYINPWDTALATYIYALCASDPDTAFLAARLVRDAPNVFWAQYAADAVLRPLVSTDAGELIISTPHRQETKVGTYSDAKEAQFWAGIKRPKGLAGEVTLYGSTSPTSPNEIFSSTQNRPDIDS